MDFVIVSDHDTIAGRHRYRDMEQTAGPMLIFGNEITTPDGHLIALGTKEEPPQEMTTQALIDWIHLNGGYAVVAHPFSKKRPWTNWQVSGIDGMEIYNFGHTLYGKNKFRLLGTSLFFGPASFLKDSIELPLDTLKFWDSMLGRGPIAAVAATDAHLKLLNAPPMRGVFKQALRAVTLYVSADQFSEQALLDNLMHGRSFIVFESLGTALNFSFKAKTPDQFFQSGQTITTRLPATFHVEAPEAHEIRLLRDGKIIDRTDGEFLRSPGKGPGAYRVEVFRREKLWILTNPIFVN